MAQLVGYGVHVTLRENTILVKEIVSFFFERIEMT